MRRVFMHIGVLCLILAIVHTLVWFAHLDPDLYYAIPPLFLLYLGGSFIVRGREPGTADSKAAGELGDDA